MSSRATRLIMGATLAALLCACAVVTSAQSAPSARPPWASKVDAVFAEWNRPGSPGCALGIYENGNIVYERGYGLADLEHDVPITPDSVFYAGSVSKQFTAMAAALVVQQGRLGADDDVRKYVPELPDYGRPITIRHLIHHMSGLRDVNTLMVLAGRRDEDAFDNDAVLRIVARQNALNFAPGDEYSYSNSGYALLALAIERAIGTPFAAFAAAQIFKPLVMTATHFHTDLSRLVLNRAFAYDRRPDGSIGLDTPQNERAGAGGLFTTVRELAQWDENFYTGRVGGLNVIRMLETPGRLNSGAPLAYGWGQMIGNYRGLPLVEHSGSLGGYRAHIIRFRVQHTSVAVLCNVSNVSTGTVVRRVADAVLGARFKEPVPPPVKPTPQPVASGPARTYSPAELAAFAGEFYSGELESAYRVAVDGDRLTLRRGVMRQALTLQAGAGDTFAVADSTLRFRRTPDGAIAGLTLDADRIRGIEFVKR